MAAESPIQPLESARQPNIWPFFVLTIVLLGLFFLVTKAMVGTSKGDADPEEAARAEVRIKNLADLRAENDAKLHTYAWADRAKGSVQIPIERAKEMIVSRLQGEPRPAYPVQPNPAASATAPAAEASPRPATP